MYRSQRLLPPSGPTAPLLPPGRRQSQGAKVTVYEPKGYELEQDRESLGILEVLQDKWEELPAHHRLVAATSLAFVVCNMDKVNMSVAIIPMAQEFGWKASVAGLVQSSFFWGYFLCQLPGGYLCSKKGGRHVMPLGVGSWSAATASLPLLAGSLPGLVLSRSMVGAGEAVAPSAATDMVARTVKASERSRAMSFIFGGLHVGSVLGLLVAPMMIDHFGWPSVFYMFGSGGLAWVAWFEFVIRQTISEEPEFGEALTTMQRHPSAMKHAEEAAEEEVPWRAILRSRPVQALGFTHFCNNWFSYTMLSWLPSYFTDTLSLDLTDAAHVSLLPPIAGVMVSGVVGQSADYLVGCGWNTALVRKLFQCMAFLGPFAALAGATHYQNDATMNIGLVTLALGLSSFSLGGLYCNHQDLSPKYSSFLLGMTNTWATIPGIIGVLLTGFLLDRTGDWPTALFAPSMVLFVAGSIVYSIYGRSEMQEFTDNEPFELEEKFYSWLGSLVPGSSVE